MANTLNLGNGNWATKEDSLLAYNSENGNFKPLPFDFTRLSKATVVNKAGLIETVGSGEPRIDFSNDAKGALLLEPQRLQLIQYSEDFSNSYWAKNNANVESNAAVSPDGTQNADKLNFTTSSGEIVKGMAFVSGQTYTMSFYAKTESGTLDFIYGNMNYSTISGTATNEWQRFVITQTLPTDTRFPKIQTTEIGSLLLWGWQVEQGSYATSYIPTQGSAVTRVADACNNGGNEQVINSTEGVLYYEISAQDNSITTSILSISNGSNTNSLYSGFSSTSNNIQAQLVVGGVAQTNMHYVVSDRTEFNKVAILYQNNNHKMYVNGVEASVDTSGSVPSANTFDRLNFDLGQGSFDLYGNVKDVRIYNTALTDAELQALTSN
jgi:hypothetical protein